MEQVKVILKKSVIGATKSQKSAVRCLGLKKIGQYVVLNLNPAVQGQLNKVQHLISTEAPIKAGSQETKKQC